MNTITTKSKKNKSTRKASSGEGDPKSATAERTNLHDSPANLHIYVNKEMINRFVKGYNYDKDFAALMRHAKEEPYDDRKFCAYRISDNGLLYFEDADHQLRLCVPLLERPNLVKEVHDTAHESAHAGWERTLAALRSRFYWPRMCNDVTEYMHTCDLCQKVKHD